MYVESLIEKTIWSVLLCVRNWGTWWFYNVEQDRQIAWLYLCLLIENILMIINIKRCDGNLKSNQFLCALQFSILPSMFHHSSIPSFLDAYTALDNTTRQSQCEVKECPIFNARLVTTAAASIVTAVLKDFFKIVCQTWLENIVLVLGTGDDLCYDFNPQEVCCLNGGFIKRC